MKEGKSLEEYLERALEKADKDLFIQALKDIEEARELAQGDDEAIGVIDARTEEIERKRRQRVQSLTGELENLLAKEKELEEATRNELEKGQEILALLERFHPDRDVLDRLYERWGGYRRRAEMLLDLKKTREKLRGLWGSSVVMLSKYDEARELALRMAERYPDDPTARLLLEEAEKRREEAYRLEGYLTTQAVVEGAFEELIEELERLKEQGEESLPWYDWGLKDIEGRPTRTLIARGEELADAAINQLAHLARTFQEDKVREYKQSAQNELPADPKAAAGWIEKALAFGYISEKTQSELQTFRDQEIEPVLETREQAGRLIEIALQPGRNIIEAWKLVEQAESTDSHPPEIERARSQLIPRLRVELESELRQADERLKEGDFETAESIASRVRELAKGNEVLQGSAREAESLIEKCRADRDLMEMVKYEAEYIKQEASTNLAAAEQALSELEDKVARFPAPFQNVFRSAQRAVKSRQSLVSLLTDWKRRFRAVDPYRLDTSEDIRQAVGDLDRLIGEIEDYIDDRGETLELTILESRGTARRDLLEGRLNREGGFYQKATGAWQRVVNKAKEAAKKDLRLAQEWLEEIEDAMPAAEALETAKEYQKKKEHQEALKTLQEWRTKPSPKQQEVQTLYRQIEDEWVKELKKEIEELGDRKAYQELDKELERRIKELEDLRPEEAQTYRYKLFPRIYGELGDLAWGIGQSSEAATHFKKAAEWARGEERIYLISKERKVRQEQVRDKVEELRSQNKRGDAVLELIEWISDFRGDVPFLAELTALSLEDGNYEQADNYIRWAERSLDAAERETIPLRAGLEQEEDIAEWRLRLEALRYKAEEVANIAIKKRLITERLQPTSSLGDYRLAQETRENLLLVLREGKEEIQQCKRERPLLDSITLKARHKIQRVWEEIEDWVDEQCSESTGIPAWYNDAERKLAEQLRERWIQTEAADKEIEFREAPPSKDLERRWEIGIKISYISRHGLARHNLKEGGEALQEITNLTRELNFYVKDLIGDPRGPEWDLEGKPLRPLDSLEIQLVWSRNALSWAELLRDMSQLYTKAIEEEPPKKEEVVETCNDIEKFIEELSEFKRAVQQVKGRLEQTISAGQGRRWERVNWYEIILQLLQSLPLSEGARWIIGGSDSQSQLPAYWRGLEDNDSETRWKRWREAAGVFQQANLFTNPQKAPWKRIIDPAIIRAGLEEKWDEILAPLSEHRERFEEHRVVEWLAQERDNAEERRKRLVLLMIELHTFVQAEDFLAALNRMEWMENLDGENRYGFRSGYVMRGFLDRDPLPWAKLEEELQALKREWERFQEWWKKVEQGVLYPWQNEARAELISLVRRADFKEAKELAEDVLRGAQGSGLTGRLGGGLALKPLLEHLTELPELQLTSHILSEVLEKVARYRHDISEAVDELCFLLELEGTARRHRVKDFDTSLEKLQKKFQEEEDALETAWEDLSRRGPILFGRGGKEAQREHCLYLLERLEKLAPDWPESRSWRQRIMEA